MINYLLSGMNEVVSINDIPIFTKNANENYSMVAHEIVNLYCQIKLCSIIYAVLGMSHAK